MDPVLTISLTAAGIAALLAAVYAIVRQSRKDR